MKYVLSFFAHALFVIAIVTLTTATPNTNPFPFPNNYYEWSELQYQLQEPSLDQPTPCMHDQWDQPTAVSFNISQLLSFSNTPSSRTIITDISQDESKPPAKYHYDVGTAMFWHSVSAYCGDVDSLADWTCASCQKFGPFTVTQVITDRQNDNQGYVGYFTQGLPASPIDNGSGRVTAGEPFVVVSFRGTVPLLLNDWIENLAFAFPTAFDSAHPHARVHRGWLKTYKKMKPQMVDGLKKALNESGATTIITVGHSLGGALAEIAAVDLKLNVYPDLNYASYTQGTPRVGNADWVKLYSSLIDASFREVHAGDKVAHVPHDILGFRHAPTEVWFNSWWSSFTVCNSDDGEDPHCSNSVGAVHNVPDHLWYRGILMGWYCDKPDSMIVQVPLPYDAPRPTPESHSRLDAFAWMLTL